MDDSSRRALAILDELRSSPLPEGPVTLSEGYRQRVERVEALAENQTGANKSWIGPALRRFRAHYLAIEGR